jgi:HEAT repeat protein
VARVNRTPAEPDAPELAARAAYERDPAARRRLIAALLSRDPDRAVPLYLPLVANPRTKDAALDALADVPDPPVAALLDALNDRRVVLRLAAARALGRIDGPATTAALVDRVRRNADRREAIAALLWSDGDDAARFVSAARTTPGLSTVVRSMEVQLKQYK